jgi:hypothetical protein
LWNCQPKSKPRWPYGTPIERDFSPGGAGVELMDRVRKQVRDGLSQPLSDGRPRQ